MKRKLIFLIAVLALVLPTAAQANNGWMGRAGQAQRYLMSGYYFQGAPLVGRQAPVTAFCYGDKRYLHQGLWFKRFNCGGKLTDQHHYTITLTATGGDLSRDWTGSRIRYYDRNWHPV